MKKRIHIFLIPLLILICNSIIAKDSYTVYDNSGQLEMEVIQLDENNHKVIKYHDNGMIAEEGYYKNGLKNGCWFAYNGKGKQISRVFFDKGQRTGVWNIEAYNAEYSYQVAYEDNKAVQIQKLDAEGTVIEEVER